MAIGCRVGDVDPGGDGPQAYALLLSGLDERQGRVEEGLAEIAVVVAPSGGDLFYSRQSRRLESGIQVDMEPTHH